MSNEQMEERLMKEREERKARMDAIAAQEKKAREEA